MTGVFALVCAPFSSAEPGQGDPPAPAPAPAPPAEPWAGSCGLFHDAVATVATALGPLRGLPRDGQWNYDEPAVAHGVGMAQQGLALAKEKATASLGAPGAQPQLRTLLENYGYSVDYLARSLSARKEPAVVQVYLGGYDKAVQDVSAFCAPPPPA